MELTIGHDFNLTPVLAYYEHPKSSDAVPKGVMYLDGGKFKVFEDRNELSICGEPSDTHDDAQSFIPALPPDVHVVTDLLLGFESSGDADKWFAAIRHALTTDIDSQTIASNSPTLSLTQVTRPPIHSLLHIHFNFCAFAPSHATASLSQVLSRTPPPPPRHPSPRRHSSITKRAGTCTHRTISKMLPSAFAKLQC